MVVGIIFYRLLTGRYKNDPQQKLKLVLRRLRTCPVENVSVGAAATEMSIILAVIKRLVSPNRVIIKPTGRDGVILININLTYY